MKNITKRNRSTMSFRLPDSMKIELENIAIENETLPSEVIRYAINNLIETNEA